MIRSVITVLRGSILAQAIGFAVLPLLSRGFSPETFGNFQAFQAIFAFLMIIVLGRYEIALLKAEDGKELSAVVTLCGFLGLATTTILVVGSGGALLLGILPDYGFAWWLLPASMLAVGATQILSYLATRDREYSAIANSKTAQGLANAGVASLLAAAAPVSSGLVLADLSGRLANAAWLARRHYSVGLVSRIAGWKEMKAAALKFRELPIVSLPSALINTAGNSLTPLFIYHTFAAGVSGQFGLAERAIGLPIALIVAAISQVHMGHLAADLRSGGDEARRSFRKVGLILAAVSIVPAIGGLMFSQAIFRVVFGEGWDQAAHFAQLMAPAYFLSLVSGGLNMTLIIVGRQRTQLVLDILRFAAMMGLWIYAPGAGLAAETIISIHSLLLSLFAVAFMVFAYRALPDGRGVPLAAVGPDPLETILPNSSRL